MLLQFHPIGNVFYKKLAERLAVRGLLGESHVSLRYDERSAWAKLLPGSVVRTLARRSMPEATLPYLRTRPWSEAGRLAAERAGLRALTAHEKGVFSVDRIFQRFDRRMAARLRSPAGARFRGVYAYEDGAADSFAAARETGKLALYDLPIGYWRAAREIMLEEAERQPEWADTIVGNRDSVAKTDRKDREIALADHIFVASSFTKKTLERAPGFTGPVHVVPYGAPGSVASRDSLKREGDALRILFVGSLGQRKGIAYLKEATELLGVPHELTIIGGRPAAPCKPLDALLARSRYIPSCPHAQVLEEMRRAHVFVFPSLFEGFGLVLLEAMSQGMVVITTEHTAGRDIIDDGEDGIIVPIRDAAAIARELESLYRDPARREGIAEKALAKAASFTWERYGDGICDIVEGLLAGGREAARA